MRATPSSLCSRQRKVSQAGWDVSQGEPPPCSDGSLVLGYHMQCNGGETLGAVVGSPEIGSPLHLLLAPQRAMGPGGLGEERLMSAM